ncbi:MAG: hypothetical protein Sapg2KO_08740 [Saprospiraceae bacterium]
MGGLTAQDVYDNQVIHTVKIQFSDTDWGAKLEANKADGESERILADVLVDDIPYKQAGVRYKGNSSYNFILQTDSKKLPFNIKLNYVDGKQRLPEGHKTLKLANGFRDPSFIREVLAYDIARDYMPASRSSFAKVYVNEEYLGLYTLVESVDNALLDSYFGEHKGVLVKCDPNYRYETPATCPEGDRSSLEYLGKDSLCYMGYYEMKSDHGWTDLINLIDVLNNDFENLEKVLDVDQTLWMLAFNNYVVNLDSYMGAFCHNYYLYQDTAGVFHPILWDLNLAFGGFRLPSLSKQMDNQELKYTSMFMHFKDNNEKRPLLTRLLKKDLYKKVYLAHVKTLLEDQGLDSLLYKRAHELQAIVGPEVTKDTNKFYSDKMFENSLYETQLASEERIIGIFDLMDDRNQYLNNHIVLKREAPEVATVDHEKDGNQLKVMASVKNAQKTWLCYRTNDVSTFKRVMLNAQDSDEAEDGLVKWSAQIDYQPGLQYYIIAEGQYNASLSPRKAAFEFYKVD